jgi:Domain of Unknown Function (DUF349)
MGLLDKLKPQPRWKHADPGVRLDAVRELDDPVELAVLAETDPEARVRRACVVKIADPEVLGRVAAGDADADVQDRAADRLLAVATSPETSEATALAAVRALTDPRRLSAIARGEAPAAVLGEALARTTEARALSSIARHAKSEPIAQAALERLTEASDLIEVAQGADQREVALSAFERVAGTSPDISLLKSIEARAQHKAVSRRARALIQEIEDAEAARRAAEEEHRRQVTAVVDSIERLEAVTDAALGRAELARLTQAWNALAATDEASEARFAAASSAARSGIARAEREAEEAVERARQRNEAIATRNALCVRVETLDADDAPEQLVPIEEEWRSLLPLVGDGPEADRLAERFALAVAACRKRHEMRAVLAETRAQLDALVTEAEALASQEDVAAALARWQSLGREARGLAAVLADVPPATEQGTAPPADPVLTRLAAVEQRVGELEAAQRDAAAKVQQDVLVQLQRLVERTARAVEAETVSLREGDRLMRDIGKGLEATGHAATTREIDEAATRLRALQEQLAPRVRDLREMDEWRRFANAQRQEQLIAMAEAIVASLKSEEEAGTASDLAATARALRELHAKWRDVAEGPRHSAQRLWDRFRTATDFIRSRCEVYFAQLRDERAVSLQRKTALVEEAEALASSSDWGRATARFQELQTEWQATGPVPHASARELAHRFRAACNTFFSRRREDLATRKKVWSDNLARKEALCERAEVLAESTEWDTAVGEMKRLQAEWKTTGPVRRSRSEAIWNRFRAATDRFFERYHNRHQIAIASKLAEREGLVAEVESLAAVEAPGAPEGLAARVQQLRVTWIRSVPIPAAEMKPLTDRWQAALRRLVERWPEAFAGSDLDPQVARQRMEKLVAKVEAFVNDVHEPAAGQSQAEILAARLRSALASNAMGGRASEDSKWRAALDAVRDAQSAWQRLAPLGGPDIRALDARFRDACRRVNDHARRHSASGRRPNKPTAAAV